MTNGEFSGIMEQIGDQAAVMLQACECDAAKIAPGLWGRLVELFRQIEDYI